MGEALSTATSEGSGYRPVSGPAVAAMVAGVLSAAALVNPFFWVVPLLGIGLACLGLADTGRPGAEKAGRMLALTGLALAVGFGAQAVSAAATQRWIARSRAQAAASLWITAVRDGRLDDARSMCLPEAVLQIDTITARIGGCAGEPSLMAIGSTTDDASGGQNVRAAFASCGIVFDIHLMPADVVRQEGMVERWMVAKCEPSAGE
jgi:hypothetical protein